MAAKVRRRGGVTDIDRGWAQLRRWFRRERGDHGVVVGLRANGPGGSKHAGGDALSVAEIGSVHEFGLGTSPERSFLRSTVDENAEKYFRFVTRQTGRTIDTLGVSPGVDRLLNRLGVLAQSDVVRKIDSGIAPELADETIERKGSSKQLVDTAQLKQSIDYEVRS